MTSFRMLAVSVLCAMVASPVVTAGDLSRYRGFQLGTNLATIAAEARMDPAQAKAVHRRPALIQELERRAQPLGPSTEAEAVSEVTFSFYNGASCRLVVNYDRYKTEGLTAEDVVEAVSATYGTADRAGAEILLPSFCGNMETLKVLSRWEDAEYSVNLVRFSHQASFTLVAVSKRLDTLARAAIIEAVRKAVKRFIRNVKTQRFNCLEIMIARRVRVLHARLSTSTVLPQLDAKSPIRSGA